MTRSQATLFGPAVSPVEGLEYRPDLLSPHEEGELVRRFADLPFKNFEFHGYVGKRRVVSFGWRYDFGDATLTEAEDLPSFLLPLRERAAEFAGKAALELPHALVTEYAPGAAIGWHRDKGVFGEVVGISLLSACVFRMRRKKGAGWERASFVAEPRSAYLLRGPARTEWEHSIPAVEGLRYSVTFRSLAASSGKGQAGASAGRRSNSSSGTPAS